MKKSLCIVLSLLLVFGCAFALVACRGGSSVEGITLNPTSLRLDVNGSAKITATLSPEGAKASVQWVSSDPQVAVVDSSGTVIGLQLGTATITASVGEISATCAVAVGHECGHKCSTCGLCTDPTCTDPVCAEKCPGHTDADNTEHFDAITKSLKLTKEYEGKSFFKDGICKAIVSPNGLVDGDTTRVIIQGGDDDGTTVTIRYHGVNTPESTGSVEKWGVAASNFNKKMLGSATELVIESSTGSAPVHDNYGVRYLGYVWYKTADYDDFKLMNVELIENGYSTSKASNITDFPYYTAMVQAEQFARSIHLRLHSPLPDPDFNDDPVPMTIKEFWDNTDRFYNSDNNAGSKVVFDAFLTSLQVTTTYTFTAAQYDETDGKLYTIPVYAAYTSNHATTMKVGHMYRIVGTVGKYNNSFQITDIKYSDSPIAGDSFTKVTQKNYWLTFSDTILDNYYNNYSDTLYSNLTVTSVSQADGFINVVGTAYKGAKTGSEPITFNVKIKAPLTGSAISVGSVLSFGGMQRVLDSHELYVPNYSDITVK